VVIQIYSKVESSLGLVKPDVFCLLVRYFNY